MKKVQQGFSIIELMIAILLGVILLLGVVQVLISSSILGRTSTSLGDNQDKARMVLGLLEGEVNRAGYRGCARGGALDITPWDASYPVVPFIANNNFGIRFSYGLDKNTTNNVGRKLVYQDCQKKDLYYRSVSFENTANGLKVKVYTEPDERTATVNEIEGVTIEKVVFTVPQDNAKFREFAVGSQANLDYFSQSDFNSEGNIAIKDVNRAKLVTFFINVKTPSGSGSNQAKRDDFVERSYSASYQLKNLGAQ